MKRKPLATMLSAIFSCASMPVFGADQTQHKTDSSLYPTPLVARARANARKYPWAAEIQKHIVQTAQPWTKLSDDQLWDLMFGCTIHRSWMVWSSGHCPACKKNIPMYNWKIDAFAQPWKARCPHCKELFPKNDFHKFYRSGLDEQGVFDPKRADRKLLFNLEHPEPGDPLRTFGVDDGNGYIDGDKRWLFVGTYLVYGQWKKLIVEGIRNLAAAYVVTGDPAYAHKAGVLLDRVADLYPTFDFGKQATLYERKADRGYVSTWHDACEEVREMVIAYDQVFDALRSDKDLVAFLSKKASACKLENPKASFADVQRNIEDRIFRDTLKNRPKIESNYPRTDVAITMLKTVLDWPDNKAEVNALIDAVVKRSTAVDGMTGEKGLAGYSTIGPRSLATFLGRFARADRTFLSDIVKRHPKLHQTFRFHVDTHCLGLYYPQSGDTGSFGKRSTGYAGIDFQRPGSLEPSAFAFLWRMYEFTKDPAFVQVLYRANGHAVKGLPYDLLAADPDAFQKAVADVIKRHGPIPRVTSINKQQWHIAILRSGQGDHARAAWLDYDSAGGHGHADGMNIGLFAKGLDLMPDYGYPPVQFGGWKGAKFNSYRATPSHCTVVVDGKWTGKGGGKTTLWADGKSFHAIRVSAPNLVGAKQYERTVALIDISDRDSYLIDVFRVVGGTDHARLAHSHFGKTTTQGLSLKPGAEYGHGALMRNFRTDSSPNPGWCVDWKIRDCYKYLPPDADVHLRLTDLTTGAQATLAEGWIVAGIFNSTEEAWIPRLMVRRQAKQAPLASAFVAVIEPYEKKSNIAGIRRLALQTESAAPYPDSNVAVEVRLADGRRDILVAADAENPLGLTPAPANDTALVQKQWKLRLDGQLCFARCDAAGNLERIALGHAKSVRIGSVTVNLKKQTEFVELRFDRGRAAVEAGDPETVGDVLLNGKTIWKR